MRNCSGKAVKQLNQKFDYFKATCIMVLKKGKANNKTLFIDAIIEEIEV